MDSMKILTTTMDGPARPFAVLHVYTSLILQINAAFDSIIIISVFKKFSIKKKSVSLAKVSRPHITWMFTSCPFCMHADWKRSQLIALLVLLEGQLNALWIIRQQTLNGVFSITLRSNSTISINYIKNGYIITMLWYCTFSVFVLYKYCSDNNALVSGVFFFFFLFFFYVFSFFFIYSAFGLDNWHWSYSP